MSNKNPFSDLFSAWTDNIPTANAFDWDSVIAAGRLNAKAFSDAAKAASEGVQAVSRRQAEIFQNNSEEISNLFKEVSSVKKPEEGAAKQAEFAKKSIETAISDSKELLEMATKSNSEANEIISKRVSSALSEFASNTNKATKKKKDAAA